METVTNILQVFWGMWTQFPLVVTILACLVAAIIRWKQHPKVSLTVVLSFGLLLLITIGFPFIYSFVPNWFRKPGDDFQTMQKIFTVISFFYNSFSAISLVLLLAAIFMRRKQVDDQKLAA